MSKQPSESALNAARAILKMGIAGRAALADDVYTVMLSGTYFETEREVAALLERHISPATDMCGLWVNDPDETGPGYWQCDGTLPVHAPRGVLEAYLAAVPRQPNVEIRPFGSDGNPVFEAGDS